MAPMPKAQSAFFISQALLILGIAWLLFRRRSNSHESQFSLREADRKSMGKPVPPRTALPNPAPEPEASKAKASGPVLLEGIQAGAAPHVVLGVSPDASRDEIQKAYRERMKQYHPDRVGRPGSREWMDAQKLAEAINRAKDEMLRKTRL